MSRHSNAPGYAWSCFACGAANGSSANSCVSCGCNASATFSEIERFRSDLLRQGIAPQAGAAQIGEFGDLSASQLVLGVLCVFLFCFWPFRAKSRGSNGA